MLMVILSESVRNKQNRRNKKELQQQQLLNKHYLRPQQRPRRQHQQQRLRQGRQQQQKQSRPKQRSQNQRDQRQSNRRPKVGSHAQAQGFNLPDLKKLPNTKFDCDENKRFIFLSL